MRVVNRLLATVLALALAAGGVLVIVEVVAAALDRGPVWWDWQAAVRWTQRTAWEDTVVRVVCAILLAAGLLLLAAELTRPRLRRLRVAPRTDDARGEPIDTAYTRRGVAEAVRAAVTRVDGVRSARVTVKRRAVKVMATAASRDRTTLGRVADDTSEAAKEAVDRLRLRSAPSVSVRTRSA
ncbi:hypothetical protein B1813_00520 [Saccharomonospora piscinae]|uniref:DUF6286 domain-containing protein n=1 Tax=Saccharomonospora piscinae TaxID=687388 RepID=A0A1V9AC32_SACPI|nr:DUF6286 domain-containing protein [Saccharomonospora piscinae]OQO94633.1 hypothetical protein B1813_00520 [Saccharomonospora piscinae]TLW94670.1 alkaline shock response membrane anchor protein AmaP [Saccharomonospora piscinae]